jgi:membrane associated rhomboid family serine protease
VSAGSPDLFVVCKSCGSEVSPYITECPYCGNRLRKRAPKIDRDGKVAEKRRRRPPMPSLSRLRGDEIPGIRPDTRPYGTLALLLAGFAGCLLWRTTLVSHEQIAVVGKPGGHWWRLITAAFTYNNTGYAFAALAGIAIFGWLLERRHGPLVVIGLFAIGGIGGLAATAALYSFPIALGANGAALALVVAWAIPDLLDLRAGHEIEGDLIGAGVFAAVLALMPLAVKEASWISGAVGVLAGLLIGLPLARASQIRQR